MGNQFEIDERDGDTKNGDKSWRYVHSGKKKGGDSRDPEATPPHWIASEGQREKGIDYRGGGGYEPKYSRNRCIARKELCYEEIELPEVQIVLLHLEEVGESLFGMGSRMGGEKKEDRYGIIRAGKPHGGLGD